MHYGPPHYPGMNPGNAAMNSLTATIKPAVLVAAVCVAGCQSNADITMPDVRGKSCQHYAEKIAELSGVVVQKETEASIETAGFLAASIGLSLLVPFAGFALIPVESEAKKDTWQAQSDLWSYRVAWEAKEC